jgi:hypothetical protein
LEHQLSQLAYDASVDPGVDERYAGNISRAAELLHDTMNGLDHAVYTCTVRGHEQGES